MAREILIVDDDPDILTTLRLTLEDEAYRVLSAPDGGVALQVLHSAKKPLPVFLDINMPRVDGLAVLRAVQQNASLQRHVITLLTAGGRTLQTEVVQLMQFLNVDIVWKPFDIKSISLAAAKMEQRLAIKR